MAGMVTRRHDMPFGAAVLAGGGVRFRLWAPAARSVALRLEGGAIRPDLPLQAAGEGWFELATDAARPGDLYRYVIDGEAALPDPASRFQPQGVHGPSEVVDPAAFAWPDGAWRGRPWEEAVIYEIHVGAFTAGGDHAGVAARLDHLAGLGVTALELMPLAATPGARSWGYDGVDLFAPEARYGRPEALKALVAAAHARGLMVLLDVVYNHFGPEGNYIARYAPAFFSRRSTNWGEAIAFSGGPASPVRAFFRHNALYWLEEYHLDGLRLDAVQAMRDDGRPHIIEEIATALRDAAGPDRPVHLVLEHDDNAARHLARAADGRPRWYSAQWNDDFHHVLHGLLTGEDDGHYRDHADRRTARLGRVLAEGFDYQGEPSLHRGGRRRGEPSGGLPPTAFVAFLQNHDTIGNRAFGERLGRLSDPAALRAAVAILLLAPQVPLLFMGEEWQADEPFLFFSDLAPELAAGVREGRRRDFAKFRQFADPALADRLPDPQDPANLVRSRLDWAALAEPRHRAWLDHYRALLAIRHAEIAPRLAGMRGGDAAYDATGPLLTVAWRLGDGSRLHLAALPDAAGGEGVVAAAGRVLFATHPGVGEGRQALPPWFVRWSIEVAGGG
jgi:maltooligosyltrehalose trehalohydrolase